jgi:tryptophan synthase alpha chain
MAEGPPIQRSALRALAKGMTLKGVLDLVRGFRTGDQTTPIILMGYTNLLVTRGFEAFARDAAEAGVDGLIVVDLPPEESAPLADALDAAGLSLVRLATPTTDDARLKVVVRRTSGFVYYVSVAGVTGVKEADADAIRPAVERVRRASGMPVAVGFGIKTPERAAAVARIADAVVVGSALVDEIAAALAESPDAAGPASVRKVLAAASALAQAVRHARRQAPVQA